MAIPPSITAGVDVVWTDVATTDIFGNAVTSATHNLTYYFRLNTAGEGKSHQDRLKEGQGGADSADGKIREGDPEGSGGDRQGNKNFFGPTDAVRAMHQQEKQVWLS